MSNYYSWYRRLDTAMILETREKLIEIAKPDNATLKLLSILPNGVRASRPPKSLNRGISDE